MICAVGIKYDTMHAEGLKKMNNPYIGGKYKTSSELSNGSRRPLHLSLKLFVHFLCPWNEYRKVLEISRNMQNQELCFRMWGGKQHNKTFKYFKNQLAKMGLLAKRDQNNRRTIYTDSLNLGYEEIVAQVPMKYLSQHY